MITPHGDPLGRIGEPEIGGQCVYIRELAAHLAALGIQVMAFTRDRGEGKPVRETIAPGAEVWRIACGPARFIPKEELLPYLDEFANGVNEHLNGQEILHSHFWDGGYVAQVLRQGNPWVHTFHSLGKRKVETLPQTERARYSERIDIETQIGEQCDRIVASSTLEQRDLTSLYGIAPKKIEVIPPGVDTTRFHPPKDKAAAKRQLGFSENPLVLSLGRLDERKGFDLFFKAAAHLLNNYKGPELPQFVLSAGTAENHPYEVAERARLQKLLSILGISEQVRWLNVLPQEELPRYYRAADVFVMPSRYELFGLVMLEAMACGVPVVATKFGGPAEVIQHGENGLLVDPNDIPALADAIAELLYDPKKRERMGKQARLRVEEAYSWRAVAQRHLELYTEGR
jgi:glycosyltransferase involved in cell wall biosynthesis